MANIGFDFIYQNDPKDAAQNIQCLFTSNYAGSIFRNRCHQNWLMGLLKMLRNKTYFANFTINPQVTVVTINPVVTIFLTYSAPSHSLTQIIETLTKCVTIFM